MKDDSGEWFTAAELEELELPGLPTTRFRIAEKAIKENWQRRPRRARGGGYEFHISSLPAAAREAIKLKRLEEARLQLMPKITSAQVKAAAASTVHEVVPLRPSDEAPLAVAKLSDRQRASMDARLVILQAIDALAATTNRKTAIGLFIAAAAEKSLPPELQQLVPIANARAGEGGRVVSVQTIKRWLKLRKRGGAALAPLERAKDPEPDWVRWFMQFYQQPQKPKITLAYECFIKCDKLPPDLQIPTLHQVRRYLAALSQVKKNKGRESAKELKKNKSWHKRDASGHDPLEIIVADGHTADWMVQHPDHGRPFRPEITSIMDARTRRNVGFSVSLKENTITVADALRHCIETFGVPQCFYTDNGPGYRNKELDHPYLGILAAFEIEHPTSIPYNSQARGLVERSHRTLWIEPARVLPGYCGRDMDATAAKKIAKQIDKDIDANGESHLLMPWGELVPWCQRQVDEYNAAPHTALPWIVDPVTGKRRHRSPNEEWQAAIDSGWAPTRIDSKQAEFLVKPQREVTCIRGLVRLWNNHYFHAALEEHGGRRVIVRFDVHDPERVWVADADGRYICTAIRDGHAIPYMGKSFAETVKEKRVRQKQALLQKKIALADAELTPQIEATLSRTTEITPEIEATYQAAIAAMPEEKPRSAEEALREMDDLMIARLRELGWHGAAECDRKVFREETMKGTWRQQHSLTHKDISEISEGEIVL
ncbi:MAG TPA: Mu transposase C-terminal domain-containing protein [Stellaceae bacterium]|jgi:putative transposase